MKITEVRSLPPADRFLYWVRERYQIYLRRKAGRPKPWTDDDILQHYFFTHPYRELDKTTVWFRENVRGPLRDDPRVLFATVAFRWFNLPATASVLMGDIEVHKQQRNLLLDWDPGEALERLRPLRDRGVQIFTGAYMINSPGGEPKLEAIVRRITNVWDNREAMSLLASTPGLSMQGVHAALTEYDGMGGFMAYEVVCDLRYTFLLQGAPDKRTWCHVGPGARRGLYRLLGLDFPKGNNAAGCPRLLDDEREQEEMRKLLATCHKRLRMPPFEMREVEHSCCEVDKYERLLWGDGRAKRRYDYGTQ